MKKYDKLLSAEEIECETGELGREWKLLGGRRLFRKYNFNDFSEAIEFVVKIAKHAEKIYHHPNICINYNEVAVNIWTHKVGGLTKMDFILAERIEDDFQRQERSRKISG